MATTVIMSEKFLLGVIEAMAGVLSRPGTLPVLSHSSAWKSPFLVTSGSFLTIWACNYSPGQLEGWSNGLNAINFCIRTDILRTFFLTSLLRQLMGFPVFLVENFSSSFSCYSGHISYVPLYFICNPSNI